MMPQHMMLLLRHAIYHLFNIFIHDAPILMLFTPASATLFMMPLIYLR